MPQPRPKASTYTAAGVNIAAAQKAVNLIKKHARSTFRSEVLSDVGFFGGLFQLKGYKEPVLVSSADDVGTKIKVAALLGRLHTVGIDIVNHCVNDILTCGAEPLFFLDYIGVGRLVPEQVEAIVQGLAAACRAAGCALIGGEMAEMPDIYTEGAHDLVGFVVGVVEKDKIIDGKTIAEGDVLLGLASSGLHTNGYSLVRQIFEIKSDVSPLQVYYPALGRTLGEELLEPHRAYYPLLKPVLPLVKGMAHITGGGLVDNVARVLPKGLMAQFQDGGWVVPPIFQFIQQQGDVAQNEMFHVFNMGIGMVIVCSLKDVDQLIAAVPEAKVIGEVTKQSGRARVVIR
ncbi:MAG: phosphoribosylformylglycinamidine cyclo-ligase [Chloroflexi bacterium]|nr:phosphoribosylformylglycinamidine cyclo-ligase [Chloroflexota bacterium]